MRPTIGRIVQYTNLGDRDGKYPPEVQAAIITGAQYVGPATSDAEAPSLDAESSYKVTLHIFYKTGQFDMDAPFTTAAPGSDEARGKWAWPPRVP